LAGSRAFQGGDTLEDALEEADFFASRSLYEDAIAILDEQLARFPNHPLLIERAREIRELWHQNAPAAAAPIGGPSTPPEEDHSFDIAASLDVIEMGDVLNGPRDTSHLANPVDVEEVFAKFKEGVKQQVSESDSETHYDLGVAYREMGLMKDAISEFDLAAKDPYRECVCFSMIGMIHRELGELEQAIESLIRGLHAERKTVDQELSIYYELGCIYELKGNPREALYYFQKVSNRDPNFRDVANRIRAIQIGFGAAPARPAANAEDDFDRAFDDLLSDHKSI
jgi:tetratricopeptide (TPR) repeat protein